MEKNVYLIWRATQFSQHLSFDNNHNAFLYLQWSTVTDGNPGLSINGKTYALPYHEDDNIDAPYPHTEYGFNHSLSEDENFCFPNHYNAYAYTITLE